MITGTLDFISYIKMIPKATERGYSHVVQRWLMKTRQTLIDNETDYNNMTLIIYFKVKKMLNITTSTRY